MSIVYTYNTTKNVVLRTNYENFNLYLEQLNDIINRREPNAKFIIMGDFNLSCIEWAYENNQSFAISYEGRMANELINTISLTELHQMNFIKNEYNRILDLVLTIVSNIIVQRKIGIVNEDPYHPAIFFKVKNTHIKFMKSKTEIRTNFFKANYIAINDELNNIHWENLLQNTNINVAIELFYKNLFNIIGKHSPKIHPKSNEFPKWYSQNLIQLIKDKEKYFKLKKLHSTNTTFNQLFINKRKEVKREKRKCLLSYESNVENMIRTNPKSFFAYTKSLHKSNQLPTVMKYGNEISQNMKQTADLFAKYFSSVYTDTQNNTNWHCNGNCNNYFYISNEEIASVINELDTNKIVSPDGIPPIFFKNTINNIIKPLGLLFNLSLSQMCYPDKWKISFISPIYKSGDSSNIENYRPISILCTAAKILDKLIHKPHTK